MASESQNLFDERTVLNQTAALRLMVGALLRDEAAADDVVQETWLTAMRSPPKPGFEPGSWLGGIARNLIRTMRRTDARRARRESQAAHSALVPGTAESVMKLERLRELLDVVSALREPIRQAIILRYFDGLMPRDISERLSIPVETVKGRLHTGLRLLRSALDERHGGSRSAWQTAFAWLAPEIAHAASAVTVASTFSFTAILGASLLMKTTLAVVVGIVVVLCVFRLSAGCEKPSLVDDRSNVGARTLTDAVPDDVVAAPPKSAPSQQASTPIRPRNVDPSASPHDGLRVLVVDESTSQPVPGAQVAWTEDDVTEKEIPSPSTDFNLARDFDVARNHTVADDAGRATISAFDHMTIAARREDRFGLRSFDVKPGGEIRLLITPSPLIRARVIDSTGAPVSGVPVLFWVSGESSKGVSSSMPGHAVSRDPDGLAILGSWGGVRWNLRSNVKVTGRIPLPFPTAVTVQAKCSLDRFRDEPLTLTLRETTSLDVTVLDPQGNAFSGHARMFLGMADGDAVPGSLPHRGMDLATDAGHVTFRAVPLGVPLRVAAFAEPFDAAIADVPTVSVGVRNAVELRFERPKAEVCGRIVHPAGTPLADADVEVRFHRPMTDVSIPTPELRIVHTGRDGRFLLIEDRGVFRDGECELEFGTCDAMLSGAIMAPPCSLEARTDLGDIPLEASKVLASGTIVDDEGIPVPGAAVVAQVSGGARGGISFRIGSRKPVGPFSRYRTTSDAAGAFRMPLAAFAKEPREWATSLTLEVTREGYVQAEPGEAVTPGSNDARIVIQRAGSIEGSILVDDRVPAATVKIRVTPDNENAVAGKLFEDCVDSDGSFRLMGVLPGTVTVTFFRGEDPSATRTIPNVFVQPTEPTREPRLIRVDLAKP